MLTEIYEDVKIDYFDCPEETANKMKIIVQDIFKNDENSDSLGNGICKKINDQIREKLKQKYWSVIHLPYSEYSISYNQLIKIKCQNNTFVIFTMIKPQKNRFVCL